MNSSSSNASDLTAQELDQLNRSTDRPTPSFYTSTSKQPITFHDILLEKDNNPIMNLDTDFLSKLSLEPEQDNPHQHPYFILITTSDKEQLYSPWQQSIIIKLLGKR